jgi:hypothetical protein
MRHGARDRAARRVRTRALWFSISPYQLMFRPAVRPWAQKLVAL